MVMIKIEYNKMGKMTSHVMDGPTFEQIPCSKVIYLAQVPCIGALISFCDEVNRRVVSVKMEEINPKINLSAQIAATVVLK